MLHVVIVICITHDVRCSSLALVPLPHCCYCFWAPARSGCEAG
eukprot:SAG25_NODE_4528_length_796_cov_0.964132_1_plen_42_part_10